MGADGCGMKFLGHPDDVQNRNEYLLRHTHSEFDRGKKIHSNSTCSQHKKHELVLY